MTLKFVLHKMWHPKRTNYWRGRRWTVLFPTLAEALYNSHKPQICAELRPLKSCLKTFNTDSELERCSLASTMCSIFPCLKNCSWKISTGSPKHVHFRLDVDDPIQLKRPLSFLKFNFESAYIPRFHLSDELL